MINVGKYEKKEVSELNNALFLKAKDILEDRQGGIYLYHIGWSGVGAFIDWLEENYEIVKKDTYIPPQKTTKSENRNKTGQMGGIKRTPADIAFSKCVRERAGWKCEKCGSQFESSQARGLDCSHHHSRGNWTIRFDPMAAEALCYGCHSHVGGTEQRRKQVLTEAEQEILWEKMNDRELGRIARKTKGKGEIAEHYRKELKRMQELRDNGETGRIEFTGYL